MVVQIKRVSLQDFEAFIRRPENTDRRFEYIAEEIIEVVSNNYASKVAARVIYLLMAFLETSNHAGDITGADGGYQVGVHRYIPDVGYISRERQPEPSHAAWNPRPPDLAVEVVSPTDDQHTLSIKIANYLLAGVVVWVIDPEKQLVVVYTPDQAPVRLDNTDAIDGAPVLPGLRLLVKELFIV